jgi:hypothetical protein
LANDQPAHGRSDDGLNSEGAHLFSEGGSETLHQWHFLQSQSALEKLPAVEATAQDEVPVEQGTGFPEQGEGFLVGHRP